MRTIDFFSLIRQASELTAYSAFISVDNFYSSNEELYLLYKAYIEDSSLVLDGYFGRLTPNDKYNVLLDPLKEYTFKGNFWASVLKNNNLVAYNHISHSTDKIQWIKGTTKFENMIWLHELPRTYNKYEFYINPDNNVFRMIYALSRFKDLTTGGENGISIGCTIEDSLYNKAPVGLRPTGTEGMYDS